jgi:hypothetical protein
MRALFDMGVLLEKPERIVGDRLAAQTNLNEMRDLV